MLDLKKMLTKIAKTSLVGEIKAYAGATEPDGWFKCDGRAVSRTTYAALFNVIGTTYGAGDGSTTFNLPDLRNRFPVGAGDTYSLNDRGGSNTVTLTVNQIPSHSHNLTYAQYNRGSGSNTASALQYTGATKATENTGGGQAHENRPPYIALNFLIYWGGLRNIIGLLTSKVRRWAVC